MDWAWVAIGLAALAGGIAGLSRTPETAKARAWQRTWASEDADTSTGITREDPPAQLPEPDNIGIEIPLVNPATGLPMIDSVVDVCGHVYGTGGPGDYSSHGVM